MRGLLPLLLVSCSYSLDRTAAEVRAERVAMERSLPPESPLWIAEGPDRFDRLVEDFNPQVPEFLYVHLLRKLRQMALPEADALSQGDFDAGDCLKDPDRFRGRVWRATGVIGEIHAESLPDAAVPVAHAGIFFDKLGRPVLFAVPQKPDVLTLWEDLVETRGVFVKIVEYTTKSGRKVTAPLLVGKVLRRFL